MPFLNERFLGIGVFLCTTSLVACALPDYQPPPVDGTSSGTGGMGTGGMGTGGIETGGNGTGGTTSSSSTSSSSSASTGSGGSTEANCLDGLDDDGDGHADCADPDCQAGYECVPAPAPNFSDLRRLHVSGVGDPPVECSPGVNPVRRFKDPSSSECTACNCTTLSTCSPWGVSLFGDSLCAGPEQQLPMPVGGCGPLPPGFSGSVFVDSAPFPIFASCQVGQSMQVNKEPFQTAVDACQVSNSVGGGCASGEVCVPRAKPEYSGRVCVASQGDVTCPAAFPSRTVAYSNANDGRSCSQCSCSADQVSCLGGAVGLSKLMDCSGTLTPVEPQVCTPTANVGGVSVKLKPAIPTLNEGACTGGVKDGAVEPQNPETYCCTP